VNLCSAAGLLIAKAVVAPGRVGTARALRATAEPALELEIASLPLFVIAAGIESFLRQSLLSTAARYAAAATALIAIIAYIGYVRHLVRRRPEFDLDWLLRADHPANRKIAVQDRRGDARGIEVEGLDTEPPDTRQCRLALDREVLQREPPIKAPARNPGFRLIQLGQQAVAQATSITQWRRASTASHASSSREALPSTKSVSTTTSARLL
jgi:hypothetical protein